jgi:hypothetical protein
MNKNLVWVSLLITSFVVSSHPYSAIAASVTPPPVPSSTETPKETPPSHKNTSPEIQIITKEDLPPGFEEVSSLKNVIQKSMGSSNGSPSSVFAFLKNEKSPILLMGLIQQLPPLPTQKDKEEFDKLLETDILPNIFISSFTRKGENLSKPEPLILTKKIGEAAKAWTTNTKIKEIPTRLDFITFRREQFFGFVIFMYMNETPETLNISDIASKMDQRLMTIMPTITPSQNTTDLKEKEK